MASMAILDVSEEPSLPQKQVPDRRVILRRLMAVFGFVLLGALAAMLLIQSIAPLFGVGDVADFIARLQAGELSERAGLLRLLTLINHLCQFALPSLAFVYFIVQNERMGDYLFANRSAKWWGLLLGGLIIILFFPLAEGFYALGHEWFEGDSGNLVLQKLLLQMDGPADLLLNLVLLGLAAGIGEELLFRGVFQRLFAQLANNAHLGIWASAILFSLIHLEMQGFLVRTLWGGFFGYLLLWTGSIWVPIVAHIVNNSWQVLAQYIAKQAELDINFDTVTYPDPLVLVVSTGLAVALSFLLYRGHREKSIGHGRYLEESVQRPL